MAIKVEWFDEEHTILRWVFEERWTWNDYATAQHESNVILESVEHTVDVIGDLDNGAGLPLNALTVYRGFVHDTAENVGMIVLVGASTFVKTMVNMFLTFFPKRVPGTDFTFANTVEEAHTLILARQQERQSPNN